MPTPKENGSAGPRRPNPQQPGHQQPGESRRDASHSRKRMMWWGGLSLAAIGALALIVLILPTYAARWYVADRLESMGVRAEGVDTLDVDVIDGEVEVGPLEVWSGDAPHGLLVDGRVAIDYGALLDGHILLESVLLAGLAADVSWDDEGRIRINGASLDQLTGPTADSGQDADDGSGGSGFGLGVPIGLGQFVLREAAITVTPPQGEPVPLNIDRVRLEDLKPWQPESVGDLSATIAMEGLDADIDGRIHLLPGVVAAHLEESVTTNALGRFAALIPTPGVSVANGTVRLKLEQDIAMAANGRLRAATFGTVELTDLRVEDAGGASSPAKEFVTAVAKATVRLDRLQFVSRDARTTVDGSASAEFSTVQVTRGEDTYRAANGSASLPQFAATLPADGPMRVEGAPKARIQAMEISGPVDGSAKELTVDFTRLLMEGPDPAAVASAQGKVALTDARLAARGTSMESDQATLALDDLAVDLGKSGMRIDGKPKLTLVDASYSASGNVSGAADRLTADMSNLVLDMGGSETSLSADGDITLASLQASSGATHFAVRDGELHLRELAAASGRAGYRLNANPQMVLNDARLSGSVQAFAQRLGMDLTKLAVRGGDGETEPAIGASASGDGPARATTVSLAGAVQWTSGRATVGDTTLRTASAELDLQDLSYDAPRSAGPVTVSGQPKLVVQQPAVSGAADASAAAFTLDLSDLEVERGGDTGLRLAAQGEARLTEATLPLAQSRLRAGSARLAMEDLTAQSAAEGTLRVRGRPDLVVRNVNLSGATEGSVEAVDVALKSLSAAVGGPRTTVEGVGTATMRTARFKVPKAAEQPAMSGTLDRLQASFQDLQAQLGAQSPAWQGDLDVTISGLTGTVAEGDAARAEVGDVDIENVQAGSAGEAGMDLAAKSVEVADIEVVITRKLFTALSTGSEDESQGPATDVQIGRFQTVGDAQIRFRDRMIDPRVQSSLSVDEFKVKGLDTATPEQEAQLRLVAVLNEFTNLRVKGEASPFAEEPEFDLDARVQGFDLPEVSPYARKYGGVQVESGQLNATADAAADDGALDASVDLTLSRLQLEKMGDGFLSGIPVKTGLALLEGPNGKITVTVPVAGSLTNPDFDISQIVSQAIGGALREAIGTAFKVLFPPAGIASLLAGDSDTEVQDVPFEPGSSQLTAQATTMLEGYGELLNRRPKLSLELCGRATGADFAARSGQSMTLAAGGDDQGGSSDASSTGDDSPGGQSTSGQSPGGQSSGGQPSGGQSSRTGDTGPQGERKQAIEDATPALRELARQRTRAVRRYLVNERGLPADRVTTCRPQWDAESGDSPRVEISL